MIIVFTGAGISKASGIDKRLFPSIKAYEYYKDILKRVD